MEPDMTKRIMGVVQDYGTRKPRIREPFAPFRALAELGYGIMIGVFVYLQVYK